MDEEGGLMTIDDMREIVALLEKAKEKTDGIVPETSYHEYLFRKIDEATEIAQNALRVGEKQRR